MLEFHLLELLNTSISRECRHRQPLSRRNIRKDRYYPIEDEKNKALYQKYKELAERDGLITVGRLAEYKYYNMDSAIESALKVVREICERQ